MKIMTLLRALLILPLFAAWSCIDRDLCYDHAHMVDVEVRFDWSKAPEAEPQTMVVQFFTLDGKHHKRYEFTDKAGGKIRVEAGEYIMLFHNGEMEVVNERGITCDTYELFTLEEGLLEPMSRDMPAPPRPSVSADEPVRYAPETVWAGALDRHEITSGSELHTITLSPEEATSHYTIEVRNVKNMSENLDISAALSGMAESYRPSTASPAGAKVTIPLSLERPDDHTLTARFVSFGHCPEEEGSHIFSIYTSEKIYYNFDVTDQMHNASDTHNIHIEIDGITLPSTDSGMAPSVDGWDDSEDIYIKLN